MPINLADGHEPDEALELVMSNVSWYIKCSSLQSQIIF